MFTEEQRNYLDAPLDGRHVKKRQQGGMTLSYIEGWQAIKEANRIFGHGNWDRATVHMECVWSGERKTRNGDKPAASYVARVRIQVRGENGESVIREGTGAGSGFGNDFGEAHESASKEAETDAMKRALMTFGNPFGLALYDKDQAEVTKANTAANGAVKVEQSTTSKENWTGPLSKTNLFKSLNNLNTALVKAYQDGDVDKFLDIYGGDNAKKVMAQAAKDMPVEWAGKNPDGENYRDAFEHMRSELTEVDRLHENLAAG